MIEVASLDVIPEGFRGDYVEVEKDGKKLFQHKDFVTVIGAMKRKGGSVTHWLQNLKDMKAKTQQSRQRPKRRL